MFPWNHYEQLSDYMKQLLNLKPNEIDQFVKKIIANHFPNTPPSQTQENRNTNTPTTPNNKNGTTEQQIHAKPLEAKVFETHEDVFIQFPVKHKQDLRAGKIFYNSNQLIIKDIPALGDKHKILLPSIVQQRGAKIHYKNGILQIKIPKADDLQFTEIDLNF